VHLEWGKLFGDKLSLPMDVRFSVGSEAYILYADFNLDEEPLDIIGLLSKTFGCSLPNYKLEIINGGFFTFFSKNGKTLTSCFPNLFPISRETAELAESDAVCFWLILNVNINLFKNLIEIGGAEKDGRLALLAVFSKAETAKEAFEKATFSACLPAFKFFGIFEFSEIKLHYVMDKPKDESKDESKKFSLCGKITIDIFKTDYKFCGSLTIKEQELTGYLESIGDFSISSLFSGNMPGITFSKLKFCVQHKFSGHANAAATATVFWIEGSVSFCNSTCTGLLYIASGKPVLARVVIGGEKGVSIVDFFNQVTGLEFPDNLFNLTFKPGSELFYADGNVPVVINGIKYPGGFHLSAKFSLALWFIELVDLNGDVSIAGGVITASVAIHDTIDFYIIKITNPTFKLSTAQNDTFIGISGNVSFFEEDCGNVSIAFANAKNSEMLISAAWQTPASFKAYFGSQPKVSFLYSKTAGFTVTGLPNFEYFAKKLDFAQKLKEYINKRGGGLCEKIGDFIGGKLIAAKFNIKPNISNKDNEILFGLNAVCIVYFAEESIEITKIPIDNLISFTINSNLTLQNLWDKIDDIIIESIDSFLDALKNNPKAFGQIIAAIVGAEALPAIISLLCRKMIDEAMKGLIEKAAAEAAAAAAAGGGIGAIWGTIQEIFDSPPTELDSPDGLKVTCKNGKITLSWNEAAKAESYEAALYDDKDTQLDRVGCIKTTKCDFDSNAQYRGNWYRFKVRAQSHGQSSDASEIRIDRLKNPPLLSSLLRDQCIELSWNEIKNAVYYTVYKTYENKSISANITATTYALTLNDSFFNRSGEFKFTIQAVHEIPEFSSCFSKAEVWSRLNPPEISIVLESGGFVISWQKVQFANAYTVTLCKEGQQDMHYSTGNLDALRIDFPLLYGAGEYHFVATACSNNGKILSSPPGSPVTLIVTLQDIANICRIRDYSGVDCIKILKDISTGITALGAGELLVKAGYDQNDIAIGIKSAFSGLSYTDLAVILINLFGLQPIFDLDGFAKKEYSAGNDGAACGLDLAKHFPDENPKSIGQAMKNAGYDQGAVAIGIKSAFPGLSYTELAVILIDIYR
jgi:hypothetical protein